jgi:hypothetical protein
MENLWPWEVYVPISFIQAYIPFVYKLYGGNFLNCYIAQYILYVFGKLYNQRLCGLCQLPKCKRNDRKMWEKFDM